MTTHAFRYEIYFRHTEALTDTQVVKLHTFLLILRINKLHLFFDSFWRRKQVTTRP
jgi:hypothetical protein